MRCSPPSGDQFKQKAAEDEAEENRSRWNCPGKKGSPGVLPPDLEAEAAYVAQITGTPKAESCPLEGITYADPWVVELTRAVALSSDLSIPLEDALGRALTQVDLLALSSMKSAQGAAWKSDTKIREQRAKNQSRKQGLL